MDLERLIAALAPADVVQRTPVDVRDLAYDARTARPGTLFFCVPGTTRDGHDFAGEAVAAGAVALVVTHALPLPVPQLVVTDVRAAMAAAADVFFGRPTDELAVAGVTGTSGKTTTAYLLHSILEAAGRRPGLVGTVETRVGDGAAEAPADDARGDRPPAPVPRDARRRQPQRRDRGLVARLRAAPARRRPPARARVHEPLARAPRLPRDDGRATSRRSGGSSSPTRRRARPSTSATSGAAGSPPSCPTRSPSGSSRRRGSAPSASSSPPPAPASRPTGSSCGRTCAAASTSRTSSRRWRSRGCWTWRRTRSRRASRRCAACPGGWSPWTRGSRSRCSSTTRTSRRRSRTSSTRRATSPRAGCSSSSARAATATARSVRSWAASPPSSPTWRSSRPTTRAARIRRRSSTRSLAGAGRDVQVELDRRAAIERAVEQAGPGDVVVIAGKGHEPGQEIGGEILPFDDREVARDALRKVLA